MSTPAIEIKAMIVLPEIGSEVEIDYAKAVSVTVASDTDYRTATEFVIQLQARSKALEAERKRLKFDFLEACKRIDEHFRAPADRQDAAILKVKNAMLTYDRQQADVRRQAEIEERRARQAAAIKAQEEAREAAQRAAEAARAAQMAQAAGDREKAIQAERDRLRAEKEVSAKQAEAEKPPVEQTLVPAQVKVEGVARKVSWKWKLKEGMPVPAQYMTVDTDKINAAVTRMKDLAAEAFPWLEVWPEDQLAIGGRKK